MPLPGGYDAVLVDPPCTGLGVLSAAAGRPLAPARGVARAAHRACSAGLLARALALARPGGRVVYSTCTLIAEENEDVVRAAGAALDDLGAEHPELAHPRLPEALLTLPHRHGTDGFFIARMRAAVSAPLPGGPIVLPSLMSADMLRVGEQLDALDRRRRAGGAR